MSLPRTRLQVEELSPRLLCSASPLTGQGHGQFVNQGFRIDVGPFYQLHGSATLQTIGHVTLRGSLEGASIDGPHQAQGSLTLNNAHGSVQIALQGPAQHGFAPLPTAFTYRVSSGSGSYQHLSDHGVAKLQLIPAPIVMPEQDIAVGPGLFHEVGIFNLMLQSA